MLISAGFYFPLKASVVLEYIKEVVDEWESLGLALELPSNVIREINRDQHSMESKRKELIRRWMKFPDKYGPACWYSLTKALREITVNMAVLAEKIEAEKGDCFLLIYHW